MFHRCFGSAALLTCLFLVLSGCGEDAPPAVTDQGVPASASTPAAQTPAPSDRNPLLGGATPNAPQPGAPQPATPSAGGGAAPASGIIDNGTKVIANGLLIPVPEGWTAEPVGQTSMNIRLGQMRLGGIDGPEGIMAITGNIGGGVDNNIARWASQIREPIGEPVRERIDLGSGLTLHTFRMEGSFHPGAMSPNAPVLTDYLSLGAIVAGGPRGDVFFKLTAPTKVLGPHEERWNAMLRQIQRVP